MVIYHDAGPLPVLSLLRYNETILFHQIFAEQKWYHNYDATMHEETKFIGTTVVQ